MVLKICPECAKDFDTMGADGRDHPGKRFCSEAHKHTWHKRNSNRGKIIMPLIMEYLYSKLEYKYSVKLMGKISDTLSKWNSYDRASGRRNDLIVSEKLNDQKDKIN